jgi:hypothetical protein
MVDRDVQVKFRIITWNRDMSGLPSSAMYEHVPQYTLVIVASSTFDVQVL